VWSNSAESDPRGVGRSGKGKILKNTGMNSFPESPVFRMVSLVFGVLVLFVGFWLITTDREPNL
jgi:hypothetical protein